MGLKGFGTWAARAYADTLIRQGKIEFAGKGKRNLHLPTAKHILPTHSDPRNHVVLPSVAMSLPLARLHLLF